jgi:hypothetical protein
MCRFCAFIKRRVRRSRRNVYERGEKSGNEVEVGRLRV